MISTTESAILRKKTRRAWLIVTSITCLLFGGLLFVAFQDDPPPDDAWMMPPHRPVADQEGNPLVQFCRFMEKTPIQGADLLKLGPGKMPGIDVVKLREFFEKNRSQSGSFDRLLESDSSQWEWPGMNERVSINTPLDFLTCAMQMTSQIQRVRIELAAREGKVSEAVDEALKSMRYGRGLCETQQCLIHLLVSSACFRMGEDDLKTALTCGAADEKLLHQVQGALEAWEPGPRLLGTAMRWDHLHGKNSANDPRALEGLKMFVSEREIFLIQHFTLPNRTLNIQLDLERPIVEATDRGFAELVREDQRLVRTLSGWRERKFWLLCNPNAGGYVALFQSLSHLHGLVLRGVQNCAMHRQTLLVVALRRFELKNGRLPARLEELCPEFLPAVPADPVDGAPMRWDAGKHSIYSIGLDLKDDHGDFHTPRNPGDRDIGIQYWWSPTPPK